MKISITDALQDEQPCAFQVNVLRLNNAPNWLRKHSKSVDSLYSVNLQSPYIAAYKMRGKQFTTGDPQLFTDCEWFTLPPSFIVLSFAFVVEFIGVKNDCNSTRHSITSAPDELNEVHLSSSTEVPALADALVGKCYDWLSAPVCPTRWIIWHQHGERKNSVRNASIKNC